MSKSQRAVHFNRGRNELFVAASSVNAKCTAPVYSSRSSVRAAVGISTTTCCKERTASQPNKLTRARHGVIFITRDAGQTRRVIEKERNNGNHKTDSRACALTRVNCPRSSIYKSVRSHSHTYVHARVHSLSLSFFAFSRRHYKTPSRRADPTASRIEPRVSSEEKDTLFCLRSSGSEESAFPLSRRGFTDHTRILFPGPKEIYVRPWWRRVYRVRRDRVPLRHSVENASRASFVSLRVTVALIKKNA